MRNLFHTADTSIRKTTNTLPTVEEGGDALFPGASETAVKYTKALNVFRATFLGILMLVAALVGLAVFRILSASEQEIFEAEYRANSARLLESFNDNLERKLIAFNSFATQITSFSLHNNLTFPYVTLPDFVMRGSHFRIQTHTGTMQWTPVVTDDQREEWEAYAYENRFHNNRAFATETWLRNQQDEEFFGPEAAGGNRLLQDQPERPETVLDDGSGYHPKIWRYYPKGDANSGTGPYLPLWQSSPLGDDSIQQLLNFDLTRSNTISGLLEIVQQTNQVVMNRASVPVPALIPTLEKILSYGQYRHQQEQGLLDPFSYVAYPVFDSFDKNSRSLVGLITASISWTRDFTNILPDNPRGGLGAIICVLSNSYNQTLVYKVDGPHATYLGEGEPQDRKFKHLALVSDINSYSEKMAAPDTRSYQTVPLNKDNGRYTLLIFPADDAGNYILTNNPTKYAAFVVGIFLFTSLMFVAFAFLVERRQHVMTDAALKNAKEAAENAKRAAQTEAELNEYLAHEIRNPLASAISASNFVSTAVEELVRTGTTSKETALLAEEDVHIILSSLHFVNEFLRTLLDLRHAHAKTLKLNVSQTDILKDVLEPSVCMLRGHSEGDLFILDCPENLVVNVDSLRLKQVVMNLGRNATKFVESGFIRFTAEALKEDGLVRIYIEDSGSGIPIEKQKNLFDKYQSSLDLLSQGSGIGLHLCKTLIDAMGGQIYLDASYDSGIEGSPGARFVVQLHTTPLNFDVLASIPCDGVVQNEDTDEIAHVPDNSEAFSRTNTPGTHEAKSEEICAPVLPENVSVLVVDDDRTLRRMLSRALNRVVPTWKITEAASGEAALDLCTDSEAYDIIFIDQYMSSYEKQLLGTETVRAMRSRGVTKSIICGLSANNMETTFVDAGADCFVLKPFKVGKAELVDELQRILSISSSFGDNNV